MRKGLAATIIFIILLTACVISGCSSETKSVSFAEETIYALPNNIFSPTINVKPRNNDYVITSSNNTIARINDGKEVQTLKEGIVTLTVSSGALSAKATLVVAESTDGRTSQAQKQDTYVLVNFVVDGQAAMAPIEVVKGQAPGHPYGSTKNGYRLNGWYADEALTTVYNFDNPINADVTVYGEWILEPALFAYEDTDDGMVVSGFFYTGIAYETAVLPSVTPAGNKVVGLKEGLFSGNTSLKEITIPKEYTYLPTNTFKECTSLKKVTFEEGSALASIGIGCFYGCTSLAEMTLPSSVKEVGGMAFYNCSSWKGSVPSLLTVINDYAYAGSGIETASLSKVITVRANAFANCASLTSVTDVAAVRSVGVAAFIGTPILTASTKSGVAVIGSIFISAAKSVYDCEISSGAVTVIAEEAFASVPTAFVLRIKGNPYTIAVPSSGLIPTYVAVAVDEGVSTAPTGNWSAYVTRICVEKTVEDVTLLVFADGNAYLKKYSGTGDILDLDKYASSSYNDGKGYKILVIKSWAISASGSKTNDTLRILKLGGAVSKIERSAITGCSKLLSIHVGTVMVPSVEDYAISTSMGGVSRPLRIYVPDGELSRYKSNFRSENTTYADIIYPESSLTNGVCYSVAMRESGNYAVLRQYNGTDESVVVPAAIKRDTSSYDVTNIDKGAFSNNDTVKSLVFGENLKGLNDYAVVSMSALETVEFLGATPPSVGSNLFLGCEKLTKIYVPAGTLEAYKALLASYASIIEERA